MPPIVEYAKRRPTGVQTLMYVGDDAATGALATWSTSKAVKIAIALWVGLLAYSIGVRDRKRRRR